MFLPPCKQTLNSDDGNANENVTWKYNVFSFVLLRDHFNSFNLYRNGELPRNQIGWSGIQVKKENEKITVVCSRSPRNLKIGSFHVIVLQGTAKECTKI